MNDLVNETGNAGGNKKTRLHHRHLTFERGSSRDCGAKVQKIIYIQ